MENVKFSEKELADVFQVEELEKRYEMGWLSGGTVTGEVSNTPSGVSASVKVSLQFK